MEGGIYLDAISHLYPEATISSIRKRQADIEEEQDQLRRLERVRAIAKRFDND